MSQTVYLFVTSERPDPYLNSIAHCFKIGIRRVVFISIRGFGERDMLITASEKELSLIALRHVNLLLDSLADGQYRFFDKKEGKEEEAKKKRVDLGTHYSESELTAIKATYKQIWDTSSKWEHKEIDYLEMRKELAKLNKEGEDPIFDVTAVSKSYLGDLVACCLLERIQNLHTFDQRAKPNFEEPWKMLFHELWADDEGKKLYRYTNIVHTPVYTVCSKSALINTTPIKALLIISVVLLLALVGINFYVKELNWIVQVTSIFSALASIISLYLTFSPPRGG